MKLFSNEEGSSLKDYRALRGGGGNQVNFIVRQPNSSSPPSVFHTVPKYPSKICKTFFFLIVRPPGFRIHPKSLKLRNSYLSNQQLYVQDIANEKNTV